MSATDHHVPQAAKPGNPAARLVHSSGVAWAAWGLTMVVLGVTVAAGTLHLRVHLREHLAERDGDILTTVALARQYANGSGSNLMQRLRNPVDQLALTLEISQIKEGVLGVRLFDQDGRFETAFPPTVIEANLDSADLPTLRALRPVSRFHQRAWLESYFLIDADPDTPASPVPLLEVVIPLHPRGDTNLVAAAQLLLDGEVVAREYARVDKHLLPLALSLFAGGAAVLSGILFWAYHRLRRAQLLVEERTALLLRANHELALAAKTCALGSVTAHLIHGLSNPLANLQDFIASHNGNGADEGYQTVAASTQRMQQLVHEVVRVLGEERGGEQYQITLAELVDVLNRKLQAEVSGSGVHMFTGLEAQGSLSNRHSNLVLLILENLIHNALKVTPERGWVRVRLRRENGKVLCEVSDQGPGVSPQVLPRLFAPCRSTHGGSGLGLAISKQLANQLGAELELKVNSPQGCVFVLGLPAELFVEEGLAQGRPPGSSPSQVLN